MNRTRRYIIEGVTIAIPLHYAELTGIYIEDYPDFVEKPVWTDEGHPIMFAGEDACSEAMEASEGGCPECGSCKYYHTAGEHSWIGICRNASRMRIKTKNNEYEIDKKEEL